jgi:hypothetical protein
MRRPLPSQVSTALALALALSGIAGIGSVQAKPVSAGAGGPIPGGSIPGVPAAPGGSLIPAAAVPTAGANHAGGGTHAGGGSPVGGATPPPVGGGMPGAQMGLPGLMR